MTQATRARTWRPRMVPREIIARKRLVMLASVAVFAWLGSSGTALAAMSWAQGPSTFAGGAVSDVVARDFNGDGIVDLVASGTAGGLRSWSPTSTGPSGSSYPGSPSTSYGFGSSLGALVADDFDRDGDADVAVLNPTDGTVIIGTNTGFTDFDATQTYATVGAPKALATGDLNNDDLTDLVVTSGSGAVAAVGVLVGNGDGSFADAGTYPSGRGSKTVVVADFDGDGNEDVATASGGVAVLPGNGDGSLQLGFDLPGVARAVVTADFNDDGRPDLAAGNAGSGQPNQFAGQNSVSVWLQSVDGRMVSSGQYQYAPVNTTGLDMVSMDTGDFDLDGHTDIVMGVQSLLSVVMLNDGAGGLGAPTGMPAYPAGVHVVDLNRDSKPDVTGIANMTTPGYGTSDAINESTPASPENTSPPEITGTPQQTRTVAASVGSWKAWSGATVSYSYQWMRCDAAGNACVAITRATTATYTPVAADVSSTLRVRVAATNSGGTSAPVSSAATSVVLPTAPVNQALPAISGTAQDGRTLSASPGTWSSAPTSYTYQWRRCSAAGSSCVSISGATASSFVLGASDVGSAVRVQVTAANAGGSSVAALSAATSAVLPAAPSNQSVPTISGTAQDGQTLTASPGSWTSSPTSYSYQWRRCDSGGSNCASISGATGTTYSLGVSDIGSTLRVQVVATNAGGNSAPAQSSNTTVVVALPLPDSVTAPSISGTPQQGLTLSASHGSWTSTPSSYTYQWRRCDAAGDNCLDITGATQTTLVATANDVDNTLRVRVAATNSGGTSAPVSSAATSVVLPTAPVNQALPAISGTAQDGRTLSASPGTWSSAPTSYTYQWRRCSAAGSSCVSISGATASSFVLGASDVGSAVRVQVTAANAGGSSVAALSAATSAVLPAAPSNQSVPTISGTAQDGQTLTASPGSWTSSPTSYSYQWRRCDSGGSNCASISGATGTTYSLGVSDIGSTLRVQVVATNAGGNSAPAQSSNTTVVVALPLPDSVTAPSISGTPQQGLTLSASHGSWTSTPSSYTYQWRRCDAAGDNCLDITGATQTTLVATANDVDNTLRVRVAATNSGGTSAPVSSAATSVVLPTAPVNQALPAISGTAQDGRTLSASPGTWSSAPTSYTYSWRRCDAAGNNCLDISGATQSTRVVTADDVDRTLRVRVTATNPGGTSELALSAPTNAVSAKPAATPTQPVGAPVVPPVPDGTPFTSPGADTRPPTVTALAVRGGAKAWKLLLAKGKLSVTFSVDEQSTGVGDLLLPAKVAKRLKITGRAPRLGGRKFVVIGKGAISGRDAVALKVKVSAKNRKKLSKARRLALVVRVTVSDRSGNETVRTKAVKLKSR